MLRALLPHACALLVTSLVACAPADGGRPEAYVVDEAPDEETAALRAAYIAAQAQPVCTPRETSECRYYFRDAEGHLHCPMSFAICSDVGRWLPCGEYRFTPEGEIAKDR